MICSTIHKTAQPGTACDQQHARFANTHLQQVDERLREGRKVASEEAEGVAGGGEAAGAADAVHVGLQARREVVVDNVGQAADVQPPGRHVSRDQHLYFAAPEIPHRLLRQINLLYHTHSMSV